MKKISVLALFLILAMVLAACAGAGGDTTGTEGAGGFVDETTMPGGGTGFEPTDELGSGNEVVQTATPSSNAGGGTTVPQTGGSTTVGTATSSAAGGGAVSTTAPAAGGVASTPTTTTGASRTSTVAAPTTAVGGAGTAVPTAQTGGVGTSVPATGAQIGDFARLSTLEGFDLQDSGGESLGAISDFVISIPEALVDYVVVERADGELVLVPWAVMAFDTAANGFSMIGEASRLDDAPAFDSSLVDFTDNLWDQDVLDFWMTGGGTVGTPAAGTSVPSTGGGTITPGDVNRTSTPVAASGVGTSVPATGTGSGMTTGTPSAVSTGTIPGTGSQVGPVDVLFSELVDADVMSGEATSGAAGNVQGTPTGAGGTSVPSIGGTSVPGMDTAGERVGTVEDVVVNMRSGAVAFVLVSAGEIMEDGSGVPATGGTSVPSTGGTSVPGAGAETSVPTMSAGAGSGTSVPSTGSAGQASGSVIPVPMEFIRIDQDNQVVLLVSVDRLRQAPELEMDALEDPINMGWDTQFNNFWVGGSATSTP